MPDHRFAYLAQGTLRRLGGRDELIESEFGKSLRDRAIQIQNRHAWKSQGRGAQFMTGMLWPAVAGDPAAFRIAITSVTAGRTPGDLWYSLETPEISGVFAVGTDGREQRIFHTSDFRIRHVSLSPDGARLAVSTFHNNFTAHLAVLDVDGTDFQEATDGDSVDLAPRWVPAAGGKLVFQSAGLGRDTGGRLAGLGPFTVQELDLNSGEMRCLAEDADFDLLGPQKTADGSLYYIRRPHSSRLAKLNPLHALKDTLLLPFRIAFAIFQFFNFFSVRYTGKPLSTSKGGLQKQPDLKQMMVWGNVLDAEAAAREHGMGDAEAPSLVPSSWRLIRHSPDGNTDVLAKNVLAFDLAADGAVLYSNGSGIYRIAPGGGRPERLLAAKMIEQVAAL